MGERETKWAEHNFRRVVRPAHAQHQTSHQTTHQHQPKIPARMHTSTHSKHTTIFLFRKVGRTRFTHTVKSQWKDNTLVPYIAAPLLQSRTCAKMFRDWPRSWAGLAHWAHPPPTTDRHRKKRKRGRRGGWRGKETTHHPALVPTRPGAVTVQKGACRA